MNAPMSLVFFLPAHNEGENLPWVVDRIHVFCANAGIVDKTILIIDDGSSDNTQDIVNTLRLMYDITVIRHEVNQGYGAALRSGLQASVETGHDWIIFCDSDRQFDPVHAKRLFDQIHASGADAVIGYREHRADGLRRHLIGWAWHRLSSNILNFNVKDIDCGFKLFSRASMETIAFQLKGEHATISPEIIARLNKDNFTVVEQAVPHFPRTHGEQSGTNFRVMRNSLIGLFKVRSLIRKETVNVYNTDKTCTAAA